MDGLEAIEINFSVCKNIIDFRIDASTYKKDYVRTDKILKAMNHATIEDKMVSIQNFGAYSLCNYITFTEEGIPFLMTQNVRHNYIDWSNLRYIDDESHLMLHKSHCKRNQVLVTMAGEYLGRVAVYDKEFVCSSNQAIAKITLKNGVSPYCVATFLNSKYGQNQINRFKTITGQPNINMALIKSLLVPEFSEDLSQVIEDIVVKANERFIESRRMYEEAEQLLIQELGFGDYIEPKEVYSTKSFSESFGTSGRLDAEYYQKKYDDYEALIKSYGKYTTIEDEFELVKDKCLFDKDVYNYTEIGDISVGNGKFSYTAIVTDELPANAKTPVKVGDVLVSKVRPNRGAVSIIDSEVDNHIVSGAFTVLRAKGSYNKELLFVLLRTHIYKDWLLKYNVGTSYPTIKDEDVMQVKIPILPEAMQLKILNYVESSNNLIDEAHGLLAKATQMVEMAIEYGEAEALK
ncbi:MAG: restriction endonuclease subunit S [Lachnospiraceae bacterium]|nr:restriction endonuclease subunit S [Lachnospiraceae bacterium]